MGEVLASGRSVKPLGGCESGSLVGKQLWRRAVSGGGTMLVGFLRVEESELEVAHSRRSGRRDRRTIGTKVEARAKRLTPTTDRS